MAKEATYYNWPSDWSKLRRDFIKTFHMSIVDIYDPFMSWIMQKFQIDIVKFDDKLHRKFGDYEEDGLSMRDIVKKNYGDAGLKLIEQLI